MKFKDKRIFLKLTTRLSLQAFNLNTIPGPQKHAGRRIMPPTNRNTQNRSLIMRQGLTIHRKAPSTEIAYLFYSRRGFESATPPGRYYGVIRAVWSPQGHSQASQPAQKGGRVPGGWLGDLPLGSNSRKNGRHRPIMPNAHYNTNFDPYSQTTHSSPNNLPNRLQVG